MLSTKPEDIDADLSKVFERLARLHDYRCNGCICEGEQRHIHDSEGCMSPKCRCNPWPEKQ